MASLNKQVNKYMFMYSKGLGIIRRRTDRRTDVYDYISVYCH